MVYGLHVCPANSNINKYYISEAKSPENTGFQTLLEYVMSLHSNGVRHAIFSSTNFSDLPAQNWGFSIESVSVSGAINVRVYKHLSADEYYFRTITVDGNWASDWQKFVFESNIKINGTGLTSASAIPWNSIHIQNSGTNAVVFFSNWTGEACFPENYGSGIILPCTDVTNKRILYIGQSGKMYTGFFTVSDKNNITWYTTTA